MSAATPALLAAADSPAQALRVSAATPALLAAADSDSAARALRA